MSLGQKQQLFQRMIVELKTWIFAQGYEIRGGDAFRDQRVHGLIGEKKSYSHKNSCHKLKLAEDLYIFKRVGDRWVWQKSLKAQTKFGEKWESMGGSWGGRFGRPDANHYSLEHKGMK